MASIADVWAKFGECSEAAQLLETELANLLLVIGANELDVRNTSDKTAGFRLLQQINRQTLGQLIKGLESKGETLESAKALLSVALSERNRLSHTFFREHNMRRHSEQGRVMMVADLTSIHTAIFDAYKATLLLSGIDLNDLSARYNLPVDHLPI